VVVPHVDEGPTGARILQIGIAQIRAIHGAIVIERRGNMEIRDFLAMLVTHDVAQPAVVHALGPVFGIPDDLVNEVAEMQDKSKAFRRCGLLVFEDHPAIGVLSALICVLATHEGEFDGATVVFGGRCECAADSAAIAAAVGESVPILVRGLKTSNQYAARPIAGCQGCGGRGRDYVLEMRVFRELDFESGVRARACSRLGRIACPQQYAVESGLSRCNTFGKQVTTFVPLCCGRLAARPGYRCRSTQREGCLDKVPA
jgi:hypothetical protein